MAAAMPWRYDPTLDRDREREREQFVATLEHTRGRGVAVAAPHGVASQRALRIAEELEDEQKGDPGERGEQPPGSERQRQRNRGRSQQERPAFARDDRMRIAAHLGIAASMRFCCSIACSFTISCTPRARSSALRGVIAAA